MRKGDPTPEQKIVEYKGEEWKLPPGHSVYEMNTNTGVVREHKITRKFDILFWRKPRYKCQYADHIIHLVAFDIHKAFIKFKHLTKDLKIRVKYEPKESKTRERKAGS